MAGDYYPTSLAAMIPFHATFNTECINYAATFPSILDAGTLAKVLANKNAVATLVNAADQAKNYADDIINYRDIWLESPLGTPVPAVPVPPGAISVALATVVGIEAFTRALVGQLKASPAMTPAISAAMGIIGPGASLGDPIVTSAEALGGSQVRLRFRMAGYSAVAVHRTRNGVTQQIGVSITSTLVDADPPLVAGQSEVRGYFVQGIIDNVPQGTISAEVQVATTP